jgi:signal transduction histidine kinase
MSTTDPKQLDIRLLLVEDDAQSAKAMLLMLRRRGLKVSHVLSGEEAVKVFDRSSFDIVVADIVLGGMTGVDVLRELRRNHPDFPFILLTAYDTIKTAIEAVRLGAHDYILKPLKNIEALIEPVRRAIRHCELISENAALKDRLQRLASEILVTEEKERHGLACDFHDTVGQSLAYAKMKMESALKALPENSPSGGSLKEIKGILDEVIQQVRTLIFNVSPPILYDLGLEAALDSLVVMARKNDGAHIHYRTADVSELLGRELSVVLFRAVRELLNNATKYAKAGNIAIELAAQDGAVSITVEDDGVGFDAGAVLAYKSDHFGYGLFSVRERLKNYDGTMQITTHKGEGTRITLSVPVQKAKKVQDRL